MTAAPAAQCVSHTLHSDQRWQDPGTRTGDKELSIATRWKQSAGLDETMAGQVCDSVIHTKETFPPVLDPCLSCICLARAAPGTARGFHLLPREPNPSLFLPCREESHRALS